MHPARWHLIALHPGRAYASAYICISPPPIKNCTLPSMKTPHFTPWLITLALASPERDITVQSLPGRLSFAAHGINWEAWHAALIMINGSDWDSRRKHTQSPLSPARAFSLFVASITTAPCFLPGVLAADYRRLACPRLDVTHHLSKTKDGNSSNKLAVCTLLLHSIRIV